MTLSTRSVVCVLILAVNSVQSETHEGCEDKCDNAQLDNPTGDAPDVNQYYNTLLKEVNYDDLVESLINHINKTHSSLNNLNNLVPANDVPGEKSLASKQSSSRYPCTCKGGECGCCTGYLLAQFNQRGCLNVSYNADEFSFNVKVSFNDRVLYRNKLSGKNPPPACVRIPRVRQLKMCVRFSNVYLAGRNIHLCANMEANWQDFQLFQIEFDCMRLGANGFAIVAPEDGGGIPIAEIDEEEQEIEDYDDSAR